MIPVLKRRLAPMSHGQTELIHTIRRCGLTSGLKLCLDAGDALSYTSGQSWLDRSGNGYDFFRGATVGAEASDPTFNGTAGQRASTNYWSFDGGDYFRYDTTNETWMENLHKNNAKFTLAAWVYFASTTQAAMCGTLQNFAGGIGFQWECPGADAIRLLVFNAGTVLSLSSAYTVSTGAWAFYAASVDEAVGANGALLYKNGTTESFTSTYVSPSASNATHKLEIGASGNAVLPLINTSRLGMFAAWEGVALTQTQLNALYQSTRGRFGV